MIGTIDLYKLAFTPNDTMYFDSTFSQNDWFDAQEHLSVENISFNGDRAFKLGSNYLDIIFNYNYIRYKLNDRYIYAFIENINYTNDNCCQLDISIDLNQTFLTELQSAISTSNIGNMTKTNNYFNTYKPYENKYSVNDYNTHNLGILNNNHHITDSGSNTILGFILLNVDPNLELYVPIDDGTKRTVGRLLKDNGLITPCSCLAFPIQYDITNHKLLTINNMGYKIGNQTEINYDMAGSSYLNAFMQTYGSYLADSCIGITFEKIAGITLEYDVEGGFNWYYLKLNSDNCSIINSVLSEKHTQSNLPTYIGDILCIHNNNTINTSNYNLETYLSNVPTPLLRSPYIYLRVGNDSEHITLNLLDFYSDIAIERPLVLTIESFTSCVYPFSTNLRFLLNNKPITDRNVMFNLITSDPVPYKISAWESYYANNKASVNDGLATAHKYGRQQDQLQFAGAVLQSGLDFATGVIPYTKAGNFYKRKKGPTDRQVTNSTTGFFSNLLNAGISYANSEIERKKEKALLDIQWNDIKSAPSDFSNMSSSLTAKYSNGPQCIEIDLYIAKNLDDIIKYHKQYGYKINRMEKLNWIDIKQHTIFDYISFNTITLKSTLPQFYTATIEQQYEQGIRFWYDYSKFMNYEIENEEL